MELVFDSSVLSAFARAGLLDLLEQLTRGHERYAPRAVFAELERGIENHPGLTTALATDWLQVVPVNSLDELVAFSKYAARLVAGNRNVGEASVLAWAQVNGAVALIDGQDAALCGRENGVSVRRSLALLAGGIRDGILNEGRVIEVVDALVRRGDARFPCSSEGFVEWARERGLL